MTAVELVGGSGRGSAERWTLDGAEFLGMCHPDDRPWLAAELPRRLEEEGEAEFTYRFVKADGSEACYRAWERVIERGSAGMVAERIAVDISGEIRAKQEQEDRRAEAEDRARMLDTIVARVPGTVFRLHYDADGRKRMLFLDGAMVRRTPELRDVLETASPEELKAFYHPDDHEALFDKLPAQLRENGLVEHSFRLLAPNGEVRWVRAWEQVTARMGDEMITEGVAIDITDEVLVRQRAEVTQAALDRTSRTLDALVGNLPGVVFRNYYPPGGIKKPLFLDGATIRRFRAAGIEPLDLPQEAWVNTFPKEDHAWLFEELPERLRREGQVEFTLRHYEPDGRMAWGRVWEKVVEFDGDAVITEGLTIDVTDEVLAKLELEAREAELRRASEMLNALVGNLPGNVFRMHYDAQDRRRFLFVDGGLVRAEPGVREWMESLTPEELRETFQPEDHDLIFVEVPRRLREKGYSVHTFRHEVPEAGLRWLRAYEKVVSRNGDEMVTEGIALDVTDEIQASRMLESTIANLPGTVYRFHYPATGLKKLTFIDGGEWRHGRAAGVDPVALSAEEYASYFPEENRHFLYEELPALLRQQGEVAFTHNHRHADGSERWARVWEKVIWRNGDEMITEGMALDVTEELQIKRALEDSERLYRELVTLAAAGVVNLDGEGRPTYVNDRFLEMAGVTRDEFQGQDWRGFVHPEDAARVAADWRAAVAVGTAYRGEFRIVCRQSGNSVWVLGQAVPNTSSDGVASGWVVTVTDITDRRQREELERQLNQAARMEALGQLAGSVAHDFNNLLGAMLGFAGFIIEDAPTGAPSRNHAERIIAAGMRGKALVEQILAFARREDSTRENFSIAELVTEIQALLAVSMPSSAQMSVAASAGTAMVNGDRHRLGQVLINLCINARDALDGRAGEVSVTVRGTHVAGPAFARLIRRPAGVAVDMAEVWSEQGTSYAVIGTFDAKQPHVSLVVADNGCGMGLGVLENIFKPFYTTKEKGKGTGLGLPMVSGTVVDHGGAVVVETREGQGTSFEIVLPVAGVEATQAEMSFVPQAEPTAAVRLLLVDNDCDFRDMLSYGLKRRGFHVEAHADPRDALAALHSLPEMWDGLVTDMVMTPMSGVDLVRAVRTAREDLPCVVCTAYTEDHVDVRGLAALGVATLLRKTMDVGEIVTAISRATKRART